MFKGLCCVTNAVLSRAAGSLLHFAGRDRQAPRWGARGGGSAAPPRNPRGLLVSPQPETGSEKGRGEMGQNRPVPLDVTRRAQEGRSTQVGPLTDPRLPS